MKGPRSGVPRVEPCSEELASAPTASARSTAGRRFSAFLCQSILLVTSACGSSSQEPEIRDVPVTLHELPACPLPDQLLNKSLVELEAFGDFGVSPETSIALSPRDLGSELGFPPASRRLEARIGRPGTSFYGSTRVRFGFPADIVVWPEAAFCTLSAPGAPYPGRGGGQALGYSPKNDLVLVAGGDAGESAAVVGALSFSLATGKSTLVDAAKRHVLLEPRAFATATEFGEKMLVSGGENPLSTRPAEERPAFETAEVFDPLAAEFEHDLIELRTPRTRHAAIVLADGGTLLIGGRGGDGEALSLLEVVDPVLGISSLGGLTELEQGRIEPSAFVSAEGEIVVVGGYDERGEPVRSVEWLTPDALAHARPSVNAPIRLGAGYVLMPAGLLAVGGCDFDAAEQAVLPCRRGVPPESWQGFWLGADGVAEAFDLDFAAPSPVLVAGEAGAPWLLGTGDDGGTGPAGPTTLRFNPWTRRFEPAPVVRSAPLTGTPLRAVTIDPGLFLVLSETEEAATLSGLRHALRHEFSRDVALVATNEPGDALRPIHLAPDRTPGDASLSYEGTLELTAGSVELTDATFLDFDAVIHVDDGPPPHFVLRGPAFGAFHVGDEGCSWPGRAPEPPYTVAVARRGPEISLSEGRSLTRCNAPAGRATLALASVPGTSVTLARWDVTRVAVIE